jgi:hypothetical protein
MERAFIASADRNRSYPFLGCCRPIQHQGADAPLSRLAIHREIAILPLRRLRRHLPLAGED